MTTYRNYLKEKHPEYLLTGVEHSPYLFGPIGVSDFARKASPLRSLNLFKPFESPNDALHEAAGVFIYPLIYLITGLVEAAIDSARVLETLFTGVRKGTVPLIAFPPVYPFLLATVVFAAVVDIVVGVLLAAGMLGKSAVGLTTGSLATVFSAADNYLFDDPKSCASPKMG